MTLAEDVFHALEHLVGGDISNETSGSLDQIVEVRRVGVSGGSCGRVGRRGRIVSGIEGAEEAAVGTAEKSSPDGRILVVEVIGE